MGQFWDSIKDRFGIAPASARSGAARAPSSPTPPARGAPEPSTAETSVPAVAAHTPSPASGAPAQAVEGPVLAGVLNSELYRLGTRANRLVGRPPQRDPVDGVLNEDRCGWKSFTDGVLNSGCHAWAPPFRRVLNAGGYRWRSH